MEFSTIPSLNTLPIHVEDNNGSEEKWVLLEDFLVFLRKNHRPTDSISRIKKSNVQKEFKGHQNGLKEADGQLKISLKSVLRYFFYHTDQLHICDKIVHQIEKKCFGKNVSTTVTTKDIYTNIVKTLYRNETIEQHIVNSLDIDETHINTLFMNYKNDFDSFEWKKICIFEYHFGKSSYYNEADTYEKLMEQKLKYLDLLNETKNIQNMLSKSSKSCIVKRLQRRKYTEQEDAVSICANNKHFPDILEAQILHLLPEDLEIDKIICVDCTSQCQHLPSIHVYLEVDSLTEEQISDICTLTQTFIEKKHKDRCGEIIFLAKGTMDLYTDKFGKSVRFELRDDIVTKKLNEKIYRVPKLREENLDDSSENNCQTCHGTAILKPLHLKSFDVLTEWSMDVPLIGQILLEGFINKDSIRKSEKLDLFVDQKLKKIYFLFDTLLNLTNKNFGLLQDINSQELAMNFQSVNTVFNVTSFSGATLSLCESEQRMREKASSDFCYFNTYLRKYEVQYETAGGMVSNKVSLRDCFLILMMDNLVRLKYHKDPVPGESRSMQICTLPITLKGVPKDALAVENWHDINICNGEDPCKCMEDKDLQKEYFVREILRLNGREQGIFESFQKMQSWGLSTLWSEVFAKGVWNTLPVLTQECESHEQQIDLEESFASMNLTASDDEGDRDLEMSLSNLAVEEINAGDENGETDNGDTDVTTDYYEQGNSDHDNENEFETIFDGVEIELENLDTDLEIEDTEMHDTENFSLDGSLDFTPITYEEDGVEVDHDNVYNN